MPKCIPGVTFLHSHQRMERENNIPEDHVIVDKKDWELVLKYLRDEVPNTILDVTFGGVLKREVGG